MVLWVAGFVSALNTAAVSLLFSALAQTVSVAASMVGTRSKLSSFFFHRCSSFTQTDFPIGNCYER